MEKQTEFLNIKGHLSFEERKILEKHLRVGTPWTSIASLMGRGLTTLRVEKKRCPKGKYTAIEAQKDYEETWERRQKNFKRIFSKEEENFIRKRIGEGASRTSIRKELRCSYFAIETWFKQNADGYKGGMISSLEARINALEELVKTLIEIIGEQKNDKED